MWRISNAPFKVSSFLLATSPDWMSALGIEEEEEEEQQQQQGTGSGGQGALVEKFEKL